MEHRRLSIRGISLIALLVAVGGLTAPSVLVHPAPMSNLGSSGPNLAVPSSVGSIAEAGVAPAASPSGGWGFYDVAPLPSGVRQSAYDARNGFVYVPSFSQSTLSVLNGSGVVASVPVGRGVTVAIYDPQNGFVYAINEFGGIAVINGTHVLATIVTGKGDYSASVDTRDGWLYVPSRSRGIVTVINGTHVVHRIRTPAEAFSSVFDPMNGYTYVSAQGYAYPTGSHGEVLIVRGTRIVTTLAVGTTPGMPAYDPLNGLVFVPNSGSNNVSVLNGTAVLRSIPAGTDPKSATFDGQDGLIYVANAGSDNLTALNATGSVRSVPLSAAPGPMGFDARAGVLIVPALASPSIFLVRTGSPTVQLSLNHGSIFPWVTVDPRDGWAYLTEGAPVQIMTFVAPVTFQQGGLPPGVSWGFTMGGTGARSTGASETAYLPNGTYSYTLADVAGWHQRTMPYSGHIRVAGAPINEPMLNFSRVVYAVSFTEHDLRKGTNWTAALGGVREQANVPTITQSEPNGTYTYMLVGPAGKRVHDLTPYGTLLVAGGAVAVPFHFINGSTFNLTFNETGLRGNFTWCVDIGWNECSSTSAITFANLTPGVYPYSVTGRHHFVVTPAQGTVTVTTQPVIVPVLYTYVAPGGGVSLSSTLVPGDPGPRRGR
jgi:YVTN family beta-propeller protein